MAPGHTGGCECVVSRIPQVQTIQIYDALPPSILEHGHWWQEHGSGSRRSQQMHEEAPLPLQLEHRTSEYVRRKVDNNIVSARESLRAVVK